MDSVKNIVCDFNNLYRAMTKCRKGVMWKDSVARYSNNGLANILKLCNSLEDGSYEIDDYYEFTIYEPKEREIASNKFKDRVFQRSFCDNYLYPTLTKSFIYDNAACQIKKGTDMARDRLAHHMQEFFKKYGLCGFVLSMDIKKYFDSTPHTTAKKATRKNVKDGWAFEQVEKIIDSHSLEDNPGVGLGLGSQPNQLIQLTVPNDIDHYIKEKLQIKPYIRYMDDMILIHHDKEYLKECLEEIRIKFEKIGLKLNTKKTQIIPLRQGINFLGFKFKLTKTGKIIKILSKKNVKKRKRKIRKHKKLVDEGKMTREKADSCYESWKAHAEKGNSYSLIQRMDIYYKKVMEGDVSTCLKN